MKLSSSFDHEILRIALDSATVSERKGKTLNQAIDAAVSQVRTKYRLSIRENIRLRKWLKARLETGSWPIDAAAMLGFAENAGETGVFNPEQFNLTPERLNYFRHQIESKRMLSWVLAWLGFFLILLAGGTDWLGRYPHFSFWLMGLFFLPGFALGEAINYGRKSFQKWITKRQSDYPDYLRYAEANRAEIERRQVLENAVNREQILRKQAEEKRRREEVKWWKTLDGSRFEAELTTFLQLQGIEAHRTGRSGDGGIDIEIRRAGKRIIVQCKAQSDFVSPSAIRDLYGTLMHEAADEAWLITTCGFYRGSRKFAIGKPIRLLTIGDVLSGCLCN